MGNKNVKKPDLKNDVELKEVPEYRRKEFLRGYNELLKSMPQIRREREEIIKRHFGEIILYNMKDVQDMDIKIAEIIGKGQTYPTLYLASSLGFNKITWSKGVERILSQSGLEQRLKYPTLRNSQRFEKLKFLILKYLEKGRRTRNI